MILNISSLHKEGDQVTYYGKPATVQKTTGVYVLRYSNNYELIKIKIGASITIVVPWIDCLFEVKL